MVAADGGGDRMGGGGGDDASSAGGCEANVVGDCKVKEVAARESAVDGCERDASCIISRAIAAAPVTAPQNAKRNVQRERVGGVEIAQRDGIWAISARVVGRGVGHWEMKESDRATARGGVRQLVIARARVLN